LIIQPYYGAFFGFIGYEFYGENRVKDIIMCEAFITLKEKEKKKKKEG